MKIKNLLEILPRLKSSDRDTDSWYVEISRVLELSGIDEPKKIYVWVKESLQGRLKETAESLYDSKNDGTHEGIVYPSLKEIKEAVEEYLQITPQEKCNKVKSLKIDRNESIKDFNWRYRKVYNNLSDDMKGFIVVKDYLTSIQTRPYACAQIITTVDTDNLTQAFKVAELAESVEEMNAKILPRKGNSSGSQVMNSFYKQRKDNGYPGEVSMSYFVPPYRVNNNFQGYNRNNITENNNSFGHNGSYKGKRNFNKSNNVVCYKCNQKGHMVYNCPYSYKQLAEMEENNNNHGLSREFGNNNLGNNYNNNGFNRNTYNGYSNNNYNNGYGFNNGNVDSNNQRLNF